MRVFSETIVRWGKVCPQIWVTLSNRLLYQLKKCGRAQSGGKCLKSQPPIPGTQETGERIPSSRLVLANQQDTIPKLENQKSWGLQHSAASLGFGFNYQYLHPSKENKAEKRSQGASLCVCACADAQYVHRSKLYSRASFLLLPLLVYQTQDSSGYEFEFVLSDSPRSLSRLSELSGPAFMELLVLRFAAWTEQLLTFPVLIY